MNKCIQCGSIVYDDELEEVKHKIYYDHTFWTETYLLCPYCHGDCEEVYEESEK